MAKGALQYVAVQHLGKPRPPGHPGWEVVLVYSSGDKVIGKYDNRRDAVSHGERKATDNKIPLQVDGKTVLDIEYIDDWRGYEMVETQHYGEFGGFG